MTSHSYNLGRINFKPSREAREYFDRLMAELREKRALDIRVTQREAFDVLVEYAREGEKVCARPDQRRPVPLPPPLKLPRPG